MDDTMDGITSQRTNVTPAQPYAYYRDLYIAYNSMGGQYADVAAYYLQLATMEVCG